MTQHAGRRRSIIAVAASVVLALVGAVVLFVATRAPDGPPQPAAAAATEAPAARSAPSPAPTSGPASGPTDTVPRKAPSAASAKGTDLGPSLSASPPVSINIPSIGVRTSTFVSLGLVADGSLEVPKDFASVGWYKDGPAPGQLGPAILAGHVDSHNGPAIFYRLGALRPGTQIDVGRKDGSTAKFTVDRIQSFRKDNFPVAQVYGNVQRAELRLITCGGSFDPKTGHYVDNVVAFAHLTG